MAGRARRFFGHPVVTILVGFVLFGPVLAIGYVALPQLLVAAAGAPPTVDGRSTDPQTLLWLGVGQLGASLLLAWLALYLYRRVITRGCEGREEVPELTFSSTARRWLPIGVAVSFGVIAITLAAIAVGGSVSAGSSLTLVGGLCAALGLGIFAGVTEELFARGVLFRITESRLGSIWALLITTVVFGLQHANNPDATILSTLAVALEGGLMLAAVYMFTRTLWGPIAVHSAWNFGQSVLGIPVSGNGQTGAVVLDFHGPDWLTGGPFGIEASVVALAVWVGLAVVLLMRAVRKGEWQTRGY